MAPEDGRRNFDPPQKQFLYFLDCVISGQLRFEEQKRFFFKDPYTSFRMHKNDPHAHALNLQAFWHDVFSGTAEGLWTCKRIARRFLYAIYSAGVEKIIHCLKPLCNLFLRRCVEERIPDLSLKMSANDDICVWTIFEHPKRWVSEIGFHLGYLNLSFCLYWVLTS